MSCSAVTGHHSGTKAAEQFGELAVRRPVHPGTAIGQTHCHHVQLFLSSSGYIDDVGGQHVCLTLDPACVLLGGLGTSEQRRSRCASDPEAGRLLPSSLTLVLGDLAQMRRVIQARQTFSATTRTSNAKTGSSCTTSGRPSIRLNSQETSQTKPSPPTTAPATSSAFLRFALVSASVRANPGTSTQPSSNTDSRCHSSAPVCAATHPRLDT